MKKSIWLSTNNTQFQSLRDSISTDVCIVGGGITGIYTAYLLAFEGLKVTLLEAHDSLANQTTAYSTGKLTIQHGQAYQTLLKNHPIEDVKLYLQANKRAIENALKVASPSSFQTADSCLYATTKEGKKTIEKEYYAYLKLGIDGSLDDESELPFPIVKSLTIKNEHQINPVEFANYFASLAVQNGASIYTNSRVTHVDKSEKCVHLENGTKVQYKKLILCTHYPIDSIKGLYSIKLEVKRSYLLASPTTNSFKGQYLSVDENSRTIRTATVEGQNYLIYGGGNHKAGTIEHTHAIYNDLEKEMVHAFHVTPPSYQWSAQDIFTPDELPYVGPLTKNDDSVYIATGFKKWGLSNALVAGEIISNDLKGIQHEAKELYSPERSKFGEHLTKLLTNTGFIATSFIGGHITRMKAPKCTHMGCKTRWNDADRTWDCACHGSRYSEDGMVLEGPAVYPLNIKKEAGT